MKNWLRHHFVPHHGNHHTPHFLRWGTVKYLLAVILLVETASLLPALAYPSFITSLNLSAVLPGALSALTNDARIESSASALTENSLLNKAAKLKAEDMAAKGYFAHTSPEGKTPWYWLNLVGYQYSFAGENLAVNFTDSADVTEAWLNSPMHKANILSRNYKEIGTGIALGMYKGKNAIYVVQLYGTPRALASVNGAAPLPAWEVFFVSPHQGVNVILLALLILTLVALFITFRHKEGRHPDLFIHGLFLVAILVSLYIANDLFMGRHVETSFLATDSMGEVR